MSPEVEKVREPGNLERILIWQKLQNLISFLLLAISVKKFWMLKKIRRQAGMS
jgi:hypothetical protein